MSAAKRFTMSIFSNTSIDDHNRGSGQVMMDGTHINIDVTIPGAILCFGSYVLKGCILLKLQILPKNSHSALLLMAD